MSYDEREQSFLVEYSDGDREELCIHELKPLLLHDRLPARKAPAKKSQPYAIGVLNDIMGEFGVCNKPNGIYILVFPFQVQVARP